MHASLAYIRAELSRGRKKQGCAHRSRVARNTQDWQQQQKKVFVVDTLCMHDEVQQQLQLVLNDLVQEQLQCSMISS